MRQVNKLEYIYMMNPATLKNYAYSGKLLLLYNYIAIVIYDENERKRIYMMILYNLIPK